MSADIIGDKTRGNNMRVTNSMISNSASAHITNAKNSLLKYSDQYTTQKKIQRPSDDPTVAVRSLKLRTTYSQLTQYAEKNVQDAMSWMDTTETALENISKKFDSMKSYFNQGANDYLKADDRKSVLTTLQQYVKRMKQTRTIQEDMYLPDTVLTHHFYLRKILTSFHIR